MSLESAAVKLELEKVKQRVIRYAVSDPGRDLLNHLGPSTSSADISAELSRVTEVKQLVEEEGDIPLTGTHHIKSAVHKASVEGVVLEPRTFVQIASTLRTCRLVRQFVAKVRTHYPVVWEIADALYTDKVLEYNIEQAIDESGAVKASASRELQAIRRAINEQYEQLKKRLEGILKNVSDLGFSQEDIITTREGRMVIPVKAEHKNRVPGFIHSASASGATVFIEPTETLELNNEIRSLQFREQREIERILRALTLQVGEARPQLMTNEDILATLDALHAKAKYSIEILGVQPTVGTDGPIRLVNARHPILLMHHGYKNTVPLDLDLGDRFRTLIISGPNAGGKSVAMKCVGLLVLMAQSGLHIPAAPESRIRFFKNVFVDIGDEQSIENDLSTFSSHLAHLKEIADRANDETLVLIDEIGAGTDPSEGTAIAASLLEMLTQRKAYTIATTHHGSMKAFAHDTHGVENGAMEFDRTTLTPTYRFRSGVPGSSYALEMADRMGLNPELLKRSRERMGKQQTRLDSLIGELELSTQRHRKEVDDLQTERKHLADLVLQYESKLKAQAGELRELKKQAVDEARAIIDRANIVIEKSVKEIREQSADKSTVKAAHDEVERLRRDIRTMHEEVVAELPPESPQLLEPGILVRLHGEGEPGEIETISGDLKTAVVLFGSIRMKVATADLRPAPEQRRERRSIGPDMLDRSEKAKAAAQGLDLRGLSGDEAIPMVDKFLDDALIAGLNRVDIIHGKGTGALKKKVADYLTGHPRVKSFRLGEWNEGGAGATVVELNTD